MSDVPAGWQPDPEHPGWLRWWDGTQWTEQRTQLAPEADAPTENAPGAQAVATAPVRATPAPGNGIASAALVVAIIGVVSGFIPALFLVAWILGALAVILGFVGRGRARQGMGRQGMATAGWLLGAAAIVLGCFGLVTNGDDAPNNTRPSTGVTSGGLVVSVARCRVDSDGTLRASGSVSNKTDSVKDIKHVQVTFLSSDGTVIASGSSVVGPFFPHDSQTYDVDVPFKQAQGPVHCTAGIEL